MKQFCIKSLAFAGVVLVGVQAFAAATFTSPFLIAALDNGLAPQDALAVTWNPSLPPPLSTPCSNADWAEVDSAVTAPQKALMNEVLTSAALSGTMVRLFITSGKCSPAGRPVYQAVSLVP
jgi:hypothetical protein